MNFELKSFEIGYSCRHDLELKPRFPCEHKCKVEWMDGTTKKVSLTGPQILEILSQIPLIKVMNKLDGFGDPQHCFNIAEIEPLQSESHILSDIFLDKVQSKN